MIRRNISGSSQTHDLFLTPQTLLHELLERIYDDGDGENRPAADDATPSADGSATATSPGKILVFCETKRSVDQIAQFINGFGERCGAIHGDRSQSDRDNTLRAFRSGRVNILVATDVAARGLDVDGIKHVINYDYPKTSEDYIHRIGRTGRRSTTGTSHTFFTEDNARQARDLVAVLREAKQDVDGELQEMAQRRHGGGGGGGGHGGGGQWRKPYQQRGDDFRQSYRRNNSWNGGNGGYGGGDGGYKPRYQKRNDYGSRDYD